VRGCEPFSSSVPMPEPGPKMNAWVARLHATHDVSKTSGQKVNYSRTCEF